LTPLTFFLIPLFTIWAGDSETGYDEYPVFYTDNTELFCEHHTVNGCILEKEGTLIVIVSRWDSIYHEWLHLMYPYYPESMIRALERESTK